MVRQGSDATGEVEVAFKTRRSATMGCGDMAAKVGPVLVAESASGYGKAKDVSNRVVSASNRVSKLASGSGGDRSCGCMGE